MDEKRGWIDINRTDTAICVGIGAIWFFLLWLASNYLSLGSAAWGH